MRAEECKLNLKCNLCEFFSHKWGEVTICQEYTTVVFPGNGEGMRKECKKCISEIEKVRLKNQTFLYDIEQKEMLKEPLSEYENQCLDLLKEYNSLKLDLTPWLDGCTPEIKDCKNLYHFFELAEEIELLFGENDPA